MQDLHLDTLKVQPPHLAKLESFNIEMDSRIMISEDELNMVVNSLVRNYQTTNVNVIKC